MYYHINKSIWLNYLYFKSFTNTSIWLDDNIKLFYTVSIYQLNSLFYDDVANLIMNFFSFYIFLFSS